MRLIALGAVVMLALVAGGVGGALVFDRLEETNKADNIAQPSSTSAPTPPETTRPSPTATSPTAASDTAVFEVLGPGVMTSQSVGEPSCVGLWEAALANAYLPEVPQTVGTPVDVTGDGVPEIFKSRLTSMTGNTVAIQDRLGRFLFCDKGDRLTLWALPNDNSFTESFFMRGDNPHCCPEGEIRVTYEWAQDHFELAWGMVRDLPDPESSTAIEPQWECILGQCPPGQAAPEGETTYMQPALSHETTTGSDEGEPPGAEGSCLSGTEEPEIQGSDVFWKRTHEALNILPPDYYTTVGCWLRVIRQDPGSSRVDVVQGTFFVDDSLGMGPDIEFYASSLVHDAIHVREYSQGRPYYGRDGELTALEVQLDVLQALNAPQRTVSCVQEIIANIDDLAYQYWNGAVPPCTR